MFCKFPLSWNYIKIKGTKTTDITAKNHTQKCLLAGNKGVCMNAHIILDSNSLFQI